MQPYPTWNSGAPLVIAHRGASLFAPENTLSAFRLAIELGADAIEFDVKLSKDKIPVVLHDATLERTTTGRGRVKKHALADLRRLDAGIKFNSRFTGEPLPTLREVVTVSQDKIMMNIELTNYDDPFDHLPGNCFSVIQNSDIVGATLFSSFNPFALLAIKRISKDARTALLINAGTPKVLQWALRRMTPYDDIHPHHSLVNESLIKAEHAKGHRVNVWTVNDFDQLLGLFKLGVNGVISDDVESALRARERAYRR